jgi:carbon-monoxide dehydrogenase medium subunit
VKLPPFEVHRPRTLREASQLLVELGDDAVAYHGGTELLLTMKLGLANYAHLIDLKSIDDLRGISLEEGTLRIGGGMTHHQVESFNDVRRSLPAMSEMLRHVANVRVRSVGTIGGNLCFADPHSDPATFLTALDAMIVCSDGLTTRRVPADEFLRGPYETVLAPGELLVGVEVLLPGVNVGVSHIRMKTHERPTITVSSTVVLSEDTVQSVRVAVGSVCSVPVVVDAFDGLVGRAQAQWEPGIEDCAAIAAEIVEPLEDSDGATDYKRALVRTFVRRGLAAAFLDAVARPEGKKEKIR